MVDNKIEEEMNVNNESEGEESSQVATIQVVESLSPIEGADLIEEALVGNYHTIVKKGEYKVGDKVIFLAPNAQVLSRHPWFDFLRDPNNPEKNPRIKVKKLRGCISMGLVVPLGLLSRSKVTNRKELPIGEDVGKILGVRRYVEPLPGNLRGEARGSFPHFLRKTDEPRIEGVHKLIERFVREEYQGPWYVSCKIDGSSFSCYLKDGRFGVASRKIDLVERPDNTYWQMARKYGLEEKLKRLQEKLGDEFAIQAEVAGPGIQKNPLNLPEVSLFAFNLWNITRQRYEDYVIFVTAMDSLDIPTVPIIHDAYPLLQPNGEILSVEELLDLANRRSALNPDAQEEGLVFRPLVEHEMYKLGRVSFKAVHPSYALREEKRRQKEGL